jgi:hypothetical protein
MYSLLLIVRQRLPIVAITAVLAALYVPKQRTATTKQSTRVRRSIPVRRAA